MDKDPTTRIHRRSWRHTCAHQQQVHRQHEDDSPISQLAMDWLVQILEYLDLRQVFVCMSVSKEWSVACRSVVRHWEQLKLSPGFVPKRRRRITLPLRNDRQFNDAMVRSLMNMHNLRLFQADSFNIDPVFTQVVHENAETLESLAYPSLPVSAGIMFPKLKDLKVQDEPSPEGILACPSLKKLEVDHFCSLFMVSQLPLEMIEEVVLSYQIGAMDDFAELLLAMQRFKHLKAAVMNYVDGKNSVTAMPGHHELAGKLVQYSSLEVLRVYCRFTGAGVMDVDIAMDMLVDWSPGLKTVSFFEVAMSDSSLVALSRLPLLQDVEVSSSVTQFTTDGVLRLLSGRARHRLQSVYISGCHELQEEPVSHECHRMAQETERVIRTIKCLKFTDNLLAFVLRFQAKSASAVDSQADAVSQCA